MANVVTITERRKLSATKSNKGLERQLNNLVNRIGEELKYYQFPTSVILSPLFPLFD
jgi:hypothetical protein